MSDEKQPTKGGFDMDSITKEAITNPYLDADLLKQHELITDQEFEQEIIEMDPNNENINDTDDDNHVLLTDDDLNHNLDDNLINDNDIINKNINNGIIEVKNDSVYQFYGHNEPVYCCSFNPKNSNQVISGGGDDVLYAWNIENEIKDDIEIICKDIIGNIIDKIEMNVNGDNLESGGILRENENERKDDHGLNRIEYNSGDVMYRYKLTNHNDTIMDCGYSVNSEYIASGGMDNIVNIYKNNTKKNKISLYETLNGPTQEIEFIKWHPKHNVLLAGSRDATLWMWEIKKSKNNKKNKKSKVLSVFAGHIGPILCGGFTSDNKHGYSGSEDGTIFIWDLKNSTSLYHLKSNYKQQNMFHTSEVTTMHHCYNHKKYPLLISGSIDGSMVLTNYKNGKILKIFNHDKHKDSVESVLFSNKNSSSVYFASASLDKTIKIFDVKKLKIRNLIKNEYSYTCIKWFNKNSDLLLAGDINGIINVYDARNGENVKTFYGHTNIIQNMDVSFDDKYIISGSDDSSVLVFSLYK